MNERRRKLILHIGTAKTGTTALQDALARSHAGLADAGFAYLCGEGMINARHIAAACVGADGFDDHLDALGLSGSADRERFRDEVSHSVSAFCSELPDSCHTIVISSEHFHSRLVDQEMVDSLARLLEPDTSETRIVCYLRRQEDLLASLYSTHLRNGGSDTLAELCDRVGTPAAHYSNYELFLDKWARSFGEHTIEVRVFDPPALVGESIIADASQLLGLPADALKEPASGVNVAISEVGQVLLRHFNRTIAQRDPRPPRAGEIRNELAEAFAGPGQRLSPASAAAMESAFESSNEAVRSRFRPDLVSLFSPTADGGRSAPTISARQASAIGRSFEIIADSSPAAAAQPSSRFERLTSRAANRLTR